MKKQINEIKNVCAAAYGVSRKLMESRTRKQIPLTARQTAMFLINKNSGLNDKANADQWNCHWSTVRHSRLKVEFEIAHIKPVKRIVSDIQSKIEEVLL